MKIKMILYKIQKRFFPKTIKSKKFVEILRMTGVKIGKGTYFFNPSTTTIDNTRPYLLEIGEYCKITAGVKILTHDYSRSVLRLKYGEIIAEARKTVIGNNVFIGIDTIILMGSKIGDNVIIGAGSVISGNIPDNVVVAGNPAKIIRTLEEHYNIRKYKYIEEAKEYAKEILFNDKNLTIQKMGAFFPLYLKRDLNEIEKNKLNIKLNGDNTEDIEKNFLNSKPYYRDFKEFKKIIENERKDDKQ